MAHDLRRQSSSIALFQIMAIISLIMAIIFIIMAIIYFQDATAGSPPRGGWATKCFRAESDALCIRTPPERHRVEEGLFLIIVPDTISTGKTFDTLASILVCEDLRTSLSATSQKHVLNLYQCHFYRGLHILLFHCDSLHTFI